MQFNKFKVFNYIKVFGITSMLYIIFSINYIYIRESNLHLHQLSFFDYHYNFFNLFYGFFLSVPFISYILSKMFENIFAMLLSTILIGGVLPGVIAFSLSNLESSYIFMYLYIYLTFALTLISRRKIVLHSQTQICTQDSTIYQIYLFPLIIFGMFGFFMYIYLWLKYHNIINFMGFFDVYGQRKLFSSTITTIEGYGIMFSKSVSVFSLLTLAIIKRNATFLFILSFIYISDYGLGGHKSSIALMIFAIIYYLYLSKINLQKIYLPFVFLVILLFSILLNITISLKLSWAIYVVAIYERIFYVTSGLFARFYDYTTEFGFFHGGSGLLGKIFNGVDNGIPATMEIGAYYFKEGVRSNANLIADGYLHFGVIGSFLQILLLWLIMNKVDNVVFKEKTIILFPFLFYYSTILQNIGLHTALLSAGMLFFILWIKFGFNIINVKRENK